MERTEEVVVVFKEEAEVEAEALEEMEEMY